MNFQQMAIVNKCRCVIKGVPFNQSLFNCFVEFDGFIKSEASVCFSKMCFFITDVIIVLVIVIVGDVQKQQQKSGISEKMIKLCFSWFFKYIVVVAVVINVVVVVIVVVVDVVFVVGATRLEPNRCMRGLGRCCLGGSQAGGDRKRRRV